MTRLIELMYLETLCDLDQLQYHSAEYDSALVEVERCRKTLKEALSESSFANWEQYCSASSRLNTLNEEYLFQAGYTSAVKAILSGLL